MTRWFILAGVATVLGVSCHDGGAGGVHDRAVGGTAGSVAGDSAGSDGQLGGASSSLAGAPSAGDAAGGVSGTGANESGSSGVAGERGLADNPGRNTCFFPATAQLTSAVLSPGFCGWVWATGISNARGIKTDARGNVLVLASGSNTVFALWDDDHDGVSSASERMALATAPAMALGLNHGLEVYNGYLYASSSTEVYRWPYNADRKPLGPPETVITGMPAGGHATRSLVADSQFLYVSVGSGSNLDVNSSRARVVRFALASLGKSPLAFATGELFADGLRNTVGMGFDEYGRLWGVDNGQDNVARTDLGGDIHEDNPAEKLNLFATPGAFYGYPFCWSEFALPPPVSAGRGSLWANTNFMTDGLHTDAWCRTFAQRPILALQAHSAPLDVLFYYGDSFPGAFRKGAFITLHGSWDRTVPTGYKVVHVAFDQGGMPSGEPTTILVGQVPAASGFRPVGLTVLPSGVLLVSSDSGTSSVIAVGYTPPM